MKFQGIKRLFQLRVGLSPLNDHKKRHNFRDTRSDVCSCACASETTKHYLTRCTNFCNERKILMDSISPILMANHVPMVGNSSIVKCLLYGDISLPPDVNSVILKAALKFMDDTERFMWLLPVLLFSWCTDDKVGNPKDSWKPSYKLKRLITSQTLNLSRTESRKPQRREDLTVKILRQSKLSKKDLLMKIRSFVRNLTTVWMVYDL